MLSEVERGQIEANLRLVEEMGDLVGSWGMSSVQCRQGSFTATVKFDRKIDVFKTQEFATMMEQCPSLYAPTLRKLLALDDEMKAVASQEPTNGDGTKEDDH